MGIVAPYASTWIGSRRFGEARPVRRLPRSCFSAFSAPCMRRLTSPRSKVVTAMSCPHAKFGPIVAVLGRFTAGTGARPSGSKISQTMDRLTPVAKRLQGAWLRAAASRSDDGRGVAPRENAGDRARRVDRADDHRQPALAREREGGGVHDPQIPGDRLVVGEAVVALGAGVGLRVGGVD